MNDKSIISMFSDREKDEKRHQEIIHRDSLYKMDKNIDNNINEEENISDDNKTASIIEVVADKDAMVHNNAAVDENTASNIEVAVDENTINEVSIKSEENHQNVCTNKKDFSDKNIRDDREINYEAIIEGILFVSGDGVLFDKIADVLDLDRLSAKTILDKVIFDYNGYMRRGLMIREINGKYQLCTRPELNSYIEKLFEQRQKHGLSQAAYETLSIVAYHANVTRATIEKIRGVNSDSSISRLLERNLIRETGRLNLPGRPMGYDVTDEFFRSFGFKSRKDLPDLSFNNEN